MHMRYGFGMLRGWLFWIIILAVAVYLIIRSQRNKSASDSFSERSNAIGILKERYAKGEIDEEEYRNRLRNLRDE